MAAPEGPTSFAGLNLAKSAVVGKGLKAYREGSSNLLGMLHKKVAGELNRPARASGSQQEDAVLDVRSILTGRKKAGRR